MDFTLNEEQAAIRDAARDFAQNVLKPGVIERDIEGKFDPELQKQMAEMGFMGMMVTPRIRWRGHGHGFLCPGHGRAFQS